jgi:hypothetical protein
MRDDALYDAMNNIKALSGILRISVGAEKDIITLYGVKNFADALANAGIEFGSREGNTLKFTHSEIESADFKNKIDSVLKLAVKIEKPQIIERLAKVVISGGSSNGKGLNYVLKYADPKDQAEIVGGIVGEILKTIEPAQVATAIGFAKSGRTL